MGIATLSTVGPPALSGQRYAGQWGKTKDFVYDGTLRPVNPTISTHRLPEKGLHPIFFTYFCTLFFQTLFFKEIFGNSRKHIASLISNQSKHSTSFLFKLYVKEVIWIRSCPPQRQDGNIGRYHYIPDHGLHPRRQPQYPGRCGYGQTGCVYHHHPFCGSRHHHYGYGR